MRRRDFLKSSSLAAAVLGAKAAGAAPGLSSPSILGKTLELRMAIPWRAKSGGYADQAAGLAQRLEAALGGRLKLHLETRVESAIDTVGSDGGDLHFGPVHGNVARHPAFGYFAGLPGKTAAEPAAFEGWLTTGGGQALWDELARPFGIKAMMAGHTGPGPGFWATRKLQSLSQIANQKIYAEGLSREVVTALGATAADLRADDVVDGLARRELLAAEWGNPTQCLAAGFPLVAKFCTIGSITDQGSVLALTINRRVWDRLTADMQATLAAVAADETRRSTADVAANDAIMRRALGETLQISFLPLPLDIDAAIQRVSEAIIADVASRDALSDRIDASYMLFVRPHRAVRRKVNVV